MSYYPLMNLYIKLLSIVHIQYFCNIQYLDIVCYKKFICLHVS
jgi:hypothetical protein